MKRSAKQSVLSRFALVSVLVATIPLAGCTEHSGSLAADEGPEENGLVNEKKQLSSVVEFGRPEGYKAAREVLSTEDRQEQLQALIEQAVAFNRVVSEASDWQEADQEVRALLSLPSLGVPQYRREQQAADAMLKHWLLEGDMNEGKQEAIAAYAGFLLENNSPQGALVLHTLKRLDGYWSEERIVEAAGATAERAESLVARKTSCEDCAAKQLVDALPRQIQSEHDLHLHQTMEAARELRAMSQGE